MGQPEQKRVRADKGKQIPGHTKHRLPSTDKSTTQHIAETRCLFLDVCVRQEDKFHDSFFGRGPSAGHLSELNIPDSDMQRYSERDSGYILTYS